MLPIEPQLPMSQAAVDVPSFLAVLMLKLRELLVANARETNSKIGSVIEDPAYWMLR